MIAAPLPSRRGSSMLEILMTVGLLAFCLGPMLISSRASIQRTDFDERRALAVNLSIRMADRLADVRYPKLVALMEAGFDPDQDPLINPETLPDFLIARQATYQKQASFREVVPGQVGVVEVEVRWRLREGGPESRVRSSKVVLNPFPVPAMSPRPGAQPVD